MDKKNRECGVLLSITSIPSKYGIGCFSKEAYEFVDLLQKAGQDYWQVLPLGPTGYGDSPYQSFSTFAGNPYFIDLDTLKKEGLLKEEDIKKFDYGNTDESVQYDKLHKSRYNILRIAFNNWKNLCKGEKIDLSYDIKEYCFFMALKDYFDGKEWILWSDDIKKRDESAISYYKNILSDEIFFYEFQQIKFFEQWNNLKKYANQKGIKIIGDIPIYVAFDSADCWANSQLFQLSDNLTPKALSGCPPDNFSKIGQLWGNPLYDWEYHKKTNYTWWINRVKKCFEIYDTLRIDHFRGFDEYYSIPYCDKTAVNGSWKKGPGIKIFDALKSELGNLDIIAEDLGFLTPSVKELLQNTSYPGMKIIQFAFDSREESDYLPYNYTKNSVVYTGTHDNDTILGWYSTLNDNDKNLALKYLNNYNTNPDEINWDFIRLAISSVSKLCIIPMQDYLNLGSDARINIPSTLGGNWVWRMKKNSFTPHLANEIKTINKLYGR